MYRFRFADPETLPHYPLPVTDSLNWQGGAGRWHVSVPLPPTPSGWIIAPSLSLLGADDYRFQFTLTEDGVRFPLTSVPAIEPAKQIASNPAVHTAIDCFHSQRALAHPVIDVICDSPVRPERYLLVISARPLELEQDAVATPNHARICTRLPPPHSQMLENPRHAGGICSPVSTAMVLAHHGRTFVWEHFIAACYDPVTRAYGVWPLSIRTASRLGSIGAIELLHGWDDVIACLERNLPVVASIRFAANELPGAPMRATAGHLLVVHGLDGDRVLVNDPAAPHHGSVTRDYAIADLGRAWFRHRGAAYILLP